MHWKITYDQERNYVRAVQGGQGTLEDQAAFLSAIFAAPFWRPSIPLVMDYGSLAVDNVDTAMLDVARQMLSILEEKLGSGRMALLCDDEEQFRIGQEFKSMVDKYLDVEMRVFRNEAEAIDWVTGTVQS